MSNRNLSSLDYRPDIDGLRALAVVSVILFHFDVPGLPGGYVGVDVFFVLSGYLMSLVITKHISEGQFSLPGFYENRIRRIFPALFVMIAVTAAIAYAVLLPYDQTAFGESIIASILYYPNFHFWSEAGYFAPASETQPLLHIWSLGVEEQFYLIFPVFLFAAIRFQCVGALIIVTLICSLATSIWSTTDHPDSAFYFLHARAWEFLLGAVVGLKIAPQLNHRWFNEPIALLGLVALLYSITMFTDAIPFPGYHALLPAAGTAMLLYTGEGIRRTKTNGLLANLAFVYIGKISYSLYLWHWPLYVFLGITYFQWSAEPTGKVFLLCTTFMLSALSWRFIEQPIRQIKARRRSVFGFAGVLSLMGVLMGAFLISQGTTQHTTHSASDPAQPPGLSQQKRIDYYSGYLSYNPQENMRSGQCNLMLRHRFTQFDFAGCLEPSEDRRNALILGDSHAAHLWFGLNEVFDEYHFLQATASRCRPLRDDVERDDCDALKNYIFYEYLPNTRIDTVILAGRWYKGEANRLRHTVDYLKPLVRHIVVVGPVVEYKTAPPRMLVEDPNRTQISLTSKRLTQHRRETNEEMKRAAKALGITYVPLFELLCSDGENCNLLADNGAPAQFDYGHLTRSGSVSLARLWRRSGWRF